jgi:RluA family pseudouridine synthase
MENGDSQREVRADRGDDGRRLDHVLVRRLADLDELSRTEIQGWIREGRVRLDGVVERRPARRVVLGSRLAIAVPPAWGDRPEIEAEDLPLTIVYEDDELVAVDKSAGMVVHPTWGHKTGTLLNALWFRARARGAERRPSPVHRLDRATSGLVLAAKTAEVASALGRAFERREVEKTYLALVRGVPERRREMLSWPLIANPEGLGRMRPARFDEEGLASSTRLGDRLLDRTLLCLRRRFARKPCIYRQLRPLATALTNSPG